MTQSSFPNWFVFLRRALERFDIRVADAANRDDRLVMSLEHRKETVTAHIRHAAPDSPHYLRTRRFHITYHGNAVPGPAGERALARLAGILTRMEHRLPRTLDLPGPRRRDTPPDREAGSPFFFCTVEKSRPNPGHTTADTGRTMAEAMIRLTARCNQQCPFCSGERVHREPELPEIRACLTDLGGRFGHLMATVTGGEPTLSPNFSECVAMLARMDMVNRVQIQTNGVGFSDSACLAGLTPDRKIHFFVSLHATRESVYNRCTGTTGQFNRAMQGIVNIAAAGHPIILNCVVSSLNIDHIADYTKGLPDMTAAGLAIGPAAGPASGLTLHFSTLICPEHNPAARDYLVPYPLLAHRLEKAVAMAGRDGIRVSPLQSSTHAAIPPCFVSPELRDDGGKAFDMDGVRVGRGNGARPWAKSDTCGQCRYDLRCMGVPGAYARRFGLDELTPVRKIPEWPRTRQGQGSP